MALKSAMRAMGIDLAGAYTRLQPEYSLGPEGRLRCVFKTWATTEGAQRILLEDGRWDGVSTQEPSISAIVLDTDDPEVLDLADRLAKKVYAALKKSGRVEKPEDV